MASSRYQSWGYKPEHAQSALVPTWASELARSLPEATVTHSILPFGNGRSYGDSCLNSSGTLIDTKGLNHIVSFDEQTGLLCAESGITLNEIINVVLPVGWFLPVTPGTGFVTLGGAIANDVHGKNHHVDGTFGNFVDSFELVQSDGQRYQCSANSNPALFNATIGGLGLTGLISTAVIQLIRVPGPFMDVRVETFYGLDEFKALSHELKNDYKYTVAWLDCAAQGGKFARGIFLAANHSERSALHSVKKKSASIPFSFPKWALNKHSIKAFNELYFYRQSRSAGKVMSQHFAPYFYPLDSVGNWNRIYGNNGFYQYQFVVPLNEQAALNDILQLIVNSGMGSFLAVLKEFGTVTSPGLLSFPRPGWCLALDFSNRGNKTTSLIRELDSIVQSANGAAYPAKDRLMSADAFKQYFPKVQQFLPHIDAKFTSDFWERVNG